MCPFADTNPSENKLNTSEQTLNSVELLLFMW